MKLLRLYIIQNKNKSLIQKCSNTFCNKKVHSLLLLYHIHLSLDHQQLVEGLQRLDHQQRLGIHDQHGRIKLSSPVISSLIYQMYLLDILITVILTIIPISLLRPGKNFHPHFPGVPKLLV